MLLTDSTSPTSPQQLPSLSAPNLTSVKSSGKKPWLSCTFRKGLQGYKPSSCNHLLCATEIGRNISRWPSFFQGLIIFEGAVYKQIQQVPSWHYFIKGCSSLSHYVVFQLETSPGWWLLFRIYATINSWIVGISVDKVVTFVYLRSFEWTEVN